MKKKDFLIIGAVLLVALLSLPVMGYIRASRAANADYVYIYADNELYATVPLGKEQVVTVDRGDGRVNKIQITKDGAYMLSSTCKNQDCVGQGEVTCDNFESRPLKYWVICLPNGVTVELRPHAE
ncbi:MAG: NusG domain II-containing protein [Oscillospiraceae bacterium]